MTSGLSPHPFKIEHTWVRIPFALQMAHYKIETKVEVLQRIEKLFKDVRNLRDVQTAIPCTDDDEDICQHFDRVIDQLEELKAKFV